MGIFQLLLTQNNGFKIGNPKVLINGIQNDIQEGNHVINAWDPHSGPGNGLNKDFSLDGWVGRYSAILLLGWGLFNPELFNEERYIEI